MPAAGGEEVVEIGTELTVAVLADQLSDRRRSRHHRGGEDHRDHAGHVHAQWRGLPTLGHAAADHPLGVLDGDPALAGRHEHDRRDDAEDDERHQHLEGRIRVVPPRLDAARDARHDRGEDHQRDPITDAALRDQLAHPHQQDGAGRQ